MGKREVLRQRRQRRARRLKLAMIGGTLVLALVVIGYQAYQGSRPIGDFVTIEKESLPYADGKALGSAEAAVTLLEFSDFQ